MTPSEHAALSAELARALGWTTYHVGDYMHVDSPCDRAPRVFDYRFPSVYGPLIEWLAQPYGSFLCVPHEDSWTVLVTRHDGGDDGEKQYRIDAATLPEAVARAVIAVKKGKI